MLHEVPKQMAYMNEEAIMRLSLMTVSIMRKEEIICFMGGLAKQRTLESN